MRGKDLAKMPCDGYKTPEKHTVLFVQKFVAQNLGLDPAQVELYCLGQRLQSIRDLRWVKSLIWHQENLKKMNKQDQTAMVIHYMV